MQGARRRLSGHKEMKDMDVKEIAGRLELAAQMVEGWGDSGCPDIERDEVLDILRRLYHDIKYAAPAQDAVCGASDAETPRCETAKTVLAGCAPHPAVGGEEVEVAIELEPVAATDVQPDDACVGEPASEPEPEQAAEPQAHDDEAVSQQKLNRRAILSLYDEDVPCVKPASAVSTAYEDFEPSLADTGECASAEAENDGGAYEITAEPAPVLGEVLGDGAKTLGDVYAGETQADDVASKAASQAVTSLRSAIGINDRFMIIRDVFGGDDIAFENAITDLDRFTDMDEALLHIHDTYRWNPNSEGTKMIIDLLVRKFS